MQSCTRTNMMLAGQSPARQTMLVRCYFSDIFLILFSLRRMSGLISPISYSELFFVHRITEYYLHVAHRDTISRPRINSKNHNSKHTPLTQYKVELCLNSTISFHHPRKKWDTILRQIFIVLFENTPFILNILHKLL